jgi:hypothetical protein
MLVHYGDMIAIPFFALLTYYFYSIEEKTKIEMILYFFSISGLIADVWFTYLYLYKKRI